MAHQPSAVRPKEVESMTDSRHLLAITACPSGVAHTYMAAEALTDAAAARGFTIDVETHGSIGVEGTFTQDSIDRADAVIIAADKNIELDRFRGKPVVVSTVSEGINRADGLIDDALVAKPLEGEASASKSAEHTGAGVIYKALMNGVSHMIPFVVTGGLMLALAYSIGGTPTQQGLVIPEGSFWYLISQIGTLAFNLMVPVLSGFIAMAIADRPGLAPGLITGFIATTPALYHSEAGAGFLGGIVTGFMSGCVALLIKKIKVHKWIAPIWPIIVIPVLTTTVVGLIFVYALGTPIAAFFTWLTTALAGMGGTQVGLLGLLLGAMIGFDMGGPVNKVAFLFAGGLIASGTSVPMGMVAVAIATPPIGMGVATLVRRRLFTDAERENGIAAIFMGFFGITEGAIPFAAAHPLQVIPANVIGSAVGAAVAGLFGVSNEVMWGGGIVAVLGVVNRPLQFFCALAVGVAVNAVLAILLLDLGNLRSRRTDRAIPDQDQDTRTDAVDAPGDAAGSPVETADKAEPATRAVSFTDYLRPDSVILDEKLIGREQVIAALAARGTATGQLKDADQIVATAMDREAMGTTAVGDALAIPHAKCDAAIEPFLGFARLSAGIDWEAADGGPVDLVFLIAVPEAAAGNEHLRILAALARTLMHERVREELYAARTPKDVIDVLSGRVRA